MSLEAELAATIRAHGDGDPFPFEEWALRVFAHQYARVPAYRAFCERRGIAPQGLALALNQLERHPEAIEAAKRLCELTPDDVLAHTTLSRIYQAAGMVPEAEAAGAQARILDWKRQLKEGQGQ